MHRGRAPVPLLVAVVCGAVAVAGQNTPPALTLGGTACARNAAAKCTTQTFAEDYAGPGLNGFIRIELGDAGQALATAAPSITCNPTNYAAICSGDPGCGTNIFQTPPQATGCTTTGTVVVCNVDFTLQKDEFTEGLDPGEVTCTVSARDDGTAGGCTGPTPCHTTTGRFAIVVTPVNDPPSFTLGVPGGKVTVQEDCGCFPSICGATAQVRAAGVLSNVIAGPYNERVYTVPQALTLQTSTTNDALFELLPSGNRVDVDINTGQVSFTPAPNAVGTATVSIVIQDDGVNPCVKAPCPAAAAPLSTAAQTFDVEVTEVNDPPSVTMTQPTIFVDEECTAQTIPNFMQIEASFPTSPTEMLQTISMMGPLVLTPASASNIFSAQPTLSASGPWSGGTTVSLDLTFTCDPAGRTTTHPPPGSNDATCLLPPPNYDPNGVMGPALGPYQVLGGGVATRLPSEPTGSVRVTTVFQDNGAAVCGANTAAVGFDIVVREVNDAPSFTLMANPDLTMFEDAYGGSWKECRPPTDVEGRCGPEKPRRFSVADFVATFTTGSPLEDRFEQLKWLFHTDHGEYFRQLYVPQYSCPLAATHDDLFIELEPHANGRATVYIDCEDTGVAPIKCGQVGFTIDVIAVNDPPSACTRMDDVTYPECGEVAGCVVEEAWLRDITPGGGDDERAQDVSASCTWGPTAATPADSEEIFTGAVSLDISSGDIRFTLKQFAQGTGFVECTLKDNGGIDKAKIKPDGTPCDMDEWTFKLTVTVEAVNDPPTFTIGSASNGQGLVLEEDSTPPVQLGFATRISPSGDPRERDQALSFACAADDTSLLSAAKPPQLVLRSGAAAGEYEADLHILPEKDAFGSTTVRCTLTDDGSCTKKDCDTEGAFRVTIMPVNDPPSLTLPQNPLNVRSSASGVMPGAVVGVPGPPNEADQSLAYRAVVVGTGADLFDQVPEVLPDGTLQYQAKPGVSGSVQLEITATDNGGGVLDTSDPVYLTLNFTEVNTPPTFALKTRDVVVMVAGRIQEVSILEGINAGGDAFHFELSGYDASLFHTPLEVGTSGVLTVNPKQIGVTPVSIKMVDHGAHCSVVTPTCPDDAQTGTLQFVVEVVDVLPLRFTKGADISVDEDSGAFSAPWAEGIAGGAGNTSTLSFSVDGYRRDLFGPEGVGVDAATGKISFTPADDMSGTALFRACLTDGVSTACDVSQITVNPVNDPPVFLVTRPSVVLPLGSTTHILDDVIAGASPGPLNEASQSVTFTTVLLDASCQAFLQDPPVFDSATSSLVVTLKQGAVGGVCELQVVATDSLGAVATAGISLRAVAVESKPTFEVGNDLYVRPTGVAVETTIPFVSNIDLQNDTTGAVGVNYFFTVTFNESKAEQIFGGNTSAYPRVDAGGSLSFTTPASLAQEASLEVYITLRRSDSSPDNLLQSDAVRRTLFFIPQDFYITPSFSVPAVTEATEDEGLREIPNWCSFANITEGILPGGSAAAASAQLSVSATDPSAFETPPSIRTAPYPSCALSFKTAKDFYGDIQLSLYFDDGTTTLSRASTLRVSPVNDAPSALLNEMFRVVHIQRGGALPSDTPVGYATSPQGSEVSLSLSPFLLSASPGADNERAQTLAWTVAALPPVGVPGFFAQPPGVVGEASSLSLRIDTSADGTALLTLTAEDSGSPALRLSHPETVQVAVAESFAFYNIRFTPQHAAGTSNVSTADAANLDVSALRQAVSGLLGVSPLRIAVHFMSRTAGGERHATVSFLEPGQGVSEHSAAEAGARLLALGPAALTSHGVRSAQRIGASPNGGDSSGGGVKGGGGGGGGDDLTWLIVATTAAAALFLTAAAVFAVKRVFVGGGGGGAKSGGGAVQKEMAPRGGGDDAEPQDSFSLPSVDLPSSGEGVEGGMDTTTSNPIQHLFPRD